MADPQIHPLIVGEGSPALRTIRRSEKFGSLMVVAGRRMRDGLWVYFCECQCYSANCPFLVDVDERFLLCEANFSHGGCFFESRATLVPFLTLEAAVRRLGILGEAPYMDALEEGLLPKGSPRDPATAYPEWTSWADVTGNPLYYSDKELSRAVGEIDIESFGLMPEHVRYQFLAHQQYYAALVSKARELGLSIEEVLANPQLLIDLGNIHKPTSGTGGGGPTYIRKKYEPAGLDLADQRQTLQWSVRAFEALGPDIRRDAVTGWHADLWNSLDRKDVLDGNGIESLEQEVLGPLYSSAPTLVDSFRADYQAVRLLKTGQRNWMQAYSIWYGVHTLRWVNFSDPGLGKTRTVPALVVALDLRLTVYIAPYRTIAKTNPQFGREVGIEDKHARIHYVEDPLPEFLEAGYHHYILLHPKLFELGDRSQRLVEQLVRLGVDLLIYDEAQLVASKDDEDDVELIKPRTRELQRLMAALGDRVRVGLLTGTPVRTHVFEAKFLFSLLGVDCPEIVDGRLGYIQALNLRAKFQRHGFRFCNHKLPPLEQYVIPFEVPADLAERLNNEPKSYLQNESLRIPYAIHALKHAKGKRVWRLTDAGLEPVMLDVDPLGEAVNPVYYTIFVEGEEGPVALIRRHLEERGQTYYECIGEANEFDAWVKNKDGALIASAVFGVGLDGAHMTSNTLVTLGMPWHPAAHTQLTARLQRQNATLPTGEPTSVIREFIPIATNVNYDISRYQRCYYRREFSDCLLNGRIAERMKRPEAELRDAFHKVLASEQQGDVTIGVAARGPMECSF